MYLEHASISVATNISLTSIHTLFPFTRRKCPICESGGVYNTFEVILEGEYGKGKDTSAVGEDLGYSRSNSNEIEEVTAKYIDYIYRISTKPKEEDLTEPKKEDSTEIFQIFDVCCLLWIC